MIEARRPRFAWPHVVSTPTLRACLVAVVGIGTVRPCSPVFAQDDAVVEWLRARAVPLGTVVPETGLEDLKPLAGIVGNARLVLLGEATHGSREFFQLKHRILEFLASEMGFRLFAREGSFGRLLPINEYVVDGRGDPVEALAAVGSWVQNTEEILDLICWARRFNERRAGVQKLTYYGIDMQDGWSSMQALEDYFRHVDPRYARRVEEVFTPLKKLDSYESVRAYSESPPEELAATAEGIAEILHRLEERRADYVAESSTEEWAVALQHARVVSQAQETWRQPGWPHSERGLRDRFMADNIESLLEQESHGVRMAVWSHNAHVSKGLWMGQERMGHHLTQRFGPAVIVFGFVFNEGSFQARHHETNEVVEHTVGPAPEESVSATLAKVGLPLFVVDIRRGPASGPVADWLHSPHPERSVGAVFNPEWEPVLITPAEHYDVLVYVERTTRARPVEGGDSWNPNSG